MLLIYPGYIINIGISYIHPREKSFLHNYLSVHVQILTFLGCNRGVYFSEVICPNLPIRIKIFELLTFVTEEAQRAICWYFWHIYILASPNILPLNAIMSPTQWKAGDLLKTTMTSIDCIWSSLMDVLPIHSLRFGPSCWFCQCYPRSKMLHLADWLAFQLFELR